MNTIAVSASGRIALLHSPEKDSLELWDLEAKRGISRLPEAVLFEPASRAGGGPPSAGGAPRMTITGWSSTFSPDGTLLAAEGARGKTALVRIWDVQTGSPVATILDSFGPVWNHDGRLLATIGTNPAHQGVQGQLRAGSHLNMVVGTTVANDHVNVWEVTPATPTCFVAAPIDWLCFSGDGSELAINGSFWQVVESPAQRFLRPSARAARGHYATFCGQGQVWSADFRRERSMKFEPIKLWQLAPEYREIELPNPRYSQLGLKRRVWGTDPATGNSKPFDADLMFPCPKSLALSPDGRLLATVCEVRTSSGGGGSVGEGTCVGLWDLASQHRVAVFNASSAMEDRLFCVGFSPDGKLVAVGGFKGISIWEVASGTRLRTLQHREKIEVVNALAFSPDGKTLVSTTTRMWNAGTKQLGQVLNPGFVHVDDVQTGRALGTWEHPGDAFWPAIAPDGRLLATACDDGLVRLWELPSGRALARWQAHESAATAVAISPDGQSLASADAGGTAKLWHLPTIRRQLAALGLDW
jgi:WD40 repeat protein